ncbi:hypothetical protein DUNSADRAFT_15014, partial [Dunaliella salina]
MLFSGRNACIYPCNNSGQQHSGARVLHQQSRGSEKYLPLRCAAARDADAGTSTTARRGLVLAAPLVLQALASLTHQPAAALAEEATVEAPTASPPSVKGGEFKELYDDILAYKFKYPVSTVSGKPLKMLLSHPPEKYSSESQGEHGQEEAGWKRESLQEQSCQCGQ